MTMFLLLGVGLFAVGAVIIHVYLVHFCMAGSAAVRSAAVGEAEAEMSNERGLTTDELQKMEEGKMEVGGGGECAVCLEEMTESQGARVLPGCRHAFHRHCVDAWLQLHPVCPLCRARLQPQPQPQPQPQSPPS